MTLGNPILFLERTLRMMIAFTYLPSFVTIVFRGMPTVWRGRHRLLLCWLVFMHAVSPGRKTLEEMARWTPATITAWRFGRLLKTTYWNVHCIVSWLAQDLLATLPAPTNGILYLFGDGSHADKRGTKNPDFSVVPFRLSFMLFSEKNNVKALKNQWVLTIP
jgi:hypothetical protein